MDPPQNIGKFLSRSNIFSLKSTLNNMMGHIPDNFS
jgi:hypothetical protein